MRCVVIAMLSLLAMPAAAHEWYPVACCNDRDCRMVEISDVVVTQEGYYLPASGDLILFSEANTSPDANYHACVYPETYSEERRGKVRSISSDYESMNRSHRCFWAPEGGA